MSARVTSARKRARTQEEEKDIPPAKREPNEDNSKGGVAGAPASSAQADGPARDGQCYEKDEEFWFDDGTVILVAGDVEFRVYKGLLAGLSPVFKDLFADRHPVRNVPIGEQQPFSCPIVRVSDSPEDLRHLLRACFSKRLGRSYDEEHPSYHEISATIRLGDKYKIAELYSRSMEYLKQYFPSTFDGWATLETYTPTDWKNYEEIGVINLGRATGELSLLPSAFIAFICTEFTGSVGRGIVHGFAREDRSEEHLSPEDVTVCFNGKTRLRTATIAAVMRTFKHVASPECKAPSDCRRALRDVLLTLEKNLDLLLSGNLFAGYETFVRTQGGLGVCPPCTTMVRRRSLKERKDVWDRLPEGAVGHRRARVEEGASAASRSVIGKCGVIESQYFCRQRVMGGVVLDYCFGARLPTWLTLHRARFIFATSPSCGLIGRAFFLGT